MGFAHGYEFYCEPKQYVAIDLKLALKSDGALVAWGSGDHGAKLSVPVGLSNVVAIATDGWVYDMALKKDGTVVEWYGISPGICAHACGLAM